MNIHSSFKQITWGDLDVKEEIAPRLQLTNIAGQTASMRLNYVVSTSSGRDKVY